MSKLDDLRPYERKALALYAATNMTLVAIGSQCGMSTSKLGTLVRRYGIGRAVKREPVGRLKKRQLPRLGQPRPSRYQRSPKNERRRTP